MKNKKVYSLIIVLFVLIIGLYYTQVFKPHHNLSLEVRNKFNDKLIPLPEINYSNVLGFKINNDMIELGRMLFNDPILSRNNDVSCASCHLSNHGFADGMSLSFGSLGHHGVTIKHVGDHWKKGNKQYYRSCGDDGFGFDCKRPMFRNALSTVNVAYRSNRFKNEGLLWDGRFGDLAFQVLLPIHTPEELCGTNPVPEDDKNYFKKDMLFKNPILIRHSFAADYHEGINLNSFNAQPKKIIEVPSYRPNGTRSIPVRNECLAIAIAKLRSVPKYVQMFKKAFGETAKVQDKFIGRALASFVSTHVSKRTPYDNFVKGKNSLSKSQLYGLASFFTPLGQEIKIGKKNLQGFGCNECHTAPYFGGKKFASLGVNSHLNSSLSKPFTVFKTTGFLFEIDTQRGSLPQCIKEGISFDQSNNYSPDMGRAIATSKQVDCFKFRVPTLRNVIETYPYFHHGTAKGQNKHYGSVKERHLAALEQAIRYHLRGPINIEMKNRQQVTKRYFDKSFLLDPFVPPEMMQFTLNYDSSNWPYPVAVDENSLSYLLDFISTGLFDPDAVKIGDLNNDVSHPDSVPSGFPPITRDYGHQVEHPPNSK